MITMQTFMDIVNYRITEGSEFCWDCYGDNAYSLDSWNSDQEGHSLSIIFDTCTQEVYEVQAHDYKRNRAYRYINPAYEEAVRVEAKNRGVDFKNAWDDLDYVTLETEEDFLSKAEAIVNGEDYDTRVQVPLDLPDHVIFELMRMAHERDVTFNEFVEGALRAEMEKLKTMK